MTFVLDLGSTEHTCRTIRCRDLCELFDTAARLLPARTLTVSHDGDTITARPATDADQVKHGRMSTYNRRGCRCDECRRASAEFHAKMRRQRAAKLAAGEVVVPHGKANTYINYACRCEDCTEAASKRRSSRGAA